jgi:hypothetical protein
MVVTDGKTAPVTGLDPKPAVREATRRPAVIRSEKMVRV